MFDLTLPTHGWLYTLQMSAAVANHAYAVVIMEGALRCCTQV
jgi:hypothetical protein